MQTTYRSSLLPIIAFTITIGALFHSACNESKADQKPTSSSSVLVEQVSRFEKELSDIKVIHQNHIKTYSDEMGCMKDSKALEIINHHNELLDKNSERLKYHQMQIIQADTTNADRNNKQLVMLKKDLLQLEADAVEIKTGFDDFSPAHVTK